MIYEWDWNEYIFLTFKLELENDELRPNYKQKYIILYVPLVHNFILHHTFIYHWVLLQWVLYQAGQKDRNFLKLFALKQKEFSSSSKGCSFVWGFLSSDKDFYA